MSRVADIWNQVALKPEVRMGRQTPDWRHINDHMRLMLEHFYNAAVDDAIDHNRESERLEADQKQILDLALPMAVAMLSDPGRANTLGVGNLSVELAKDMLKSAGNVILEANREVSGD